MLVTPRVYKLHQDQVPQRELWSSIRDRFDPVAGWHDLPASTKAHVQKMLLVHQTGSVRLGEVVRYTLTYRPSDDRIVPTPPNLHVKIRNSSAVALRAAYLHGPYTLYTACYPSTFDPVHAHGSPDEFGYPQFEGNLKAGSSWHAELKVPESIYESFVSGTNRRQSAGGGGGSMTWIIEITSQVLFSASVAVNYEMLIGRDEKSVDFGFAGLGSVPNASPGTLSDFQLQRNGKQPAVTQTEGVYSKAIQLTIDDTASLWNTPALPGDEQEEKNRERLRANPVLSDADPTRAVKEDPDPRKVLENEASQAPKQSERQKIHLVLLTHGLHSNLGADMLYLKESIDAAAKQARLDRNMRRAKESAHKAHDKAQASLTREDQKNPPASTAPLTGGQADLDNDVLEEAEDDEQVIVRGFPGNAVKTERGIQYLGKRLAKYILAMTYPDQPYLPVKKKSMKKTLSGAFGSSDKDPKVVNGEQIHGRSTIRKEPVPDTNLAYQISSISFIGHSLGGLVQMYAIAYIQKHSPEFFQLIKPINFVALASPFLGLSNENPLYVKFALDFGLVGRTGQDLGLTWRAPTMVRSGWGAMIAGIGSEGQRRKSRLEPRSKPLLRILPTGPAHQVLRMFRNRTIYSNVVNDGIVPLRTSCLLFLDWQGLGRVENARRDNGLIGTVAGWGWAELMGQNSADQLQAPWKAWFESEDSNDDRPGSNMDRKETRTTVPQPSDDAVLDHANVSAPSSPVDDRRFSLQGKQPQDGPGEAQRRRSNSDAGSSPFSGFLALLKPSGSGSKSSNSSKYNNQEPKHARIYKRSQTIKFDANEGNDGDGSASVDTNDQSEPRPGLARGESALLDSGVIAPPKTSVFESAGDILNPPLPTKEYITDPSSRARTIFHDRVYHPEDIPQAPARPKSLFRRPSSLNGRRSTKSSLDSASTASAGEPGSMKVEEKIARGYHHELSWRKVLVRLEPDAHNNIVVRRMFSNAYGWPVVKHIVDTHFADTAAAKLADIREAGVERAKPMDEAGGDNEVKEPVRRRTDEVLAQMGSGARDGADGSVGAPSIDVDSSIEGGAEERDAVPELHGAPRSKQSSMRTGTASRGESATWDDGFFNSDEDDDEDDDDFENYARPGSPRVQPPLAERQDAEHGTVAAKGKAVAKVDTSSSPVALPVSTSPKAAQTSELGLRKSLEEQMERSSAQQGER